MTKINNKLDRSDELRLEENGVLNTSLRRSLSSDVQDLLKDSG